MLYYIVHVFGEKNLSEKKTLFSLQRLTNMQVLQLYYIFGRHWMLTQGDHRKLIKVVNMEKTIVTWKKDRTLPR